MFVMLVWALILCPACTATRYRRSHNEHGHTRPRRADWPSRDNSPEKDGMPAVAVVNPFPWYANSAVSLFPTEAAF